MQKYNYFLKGQKFFSYNKWCQTIQLAAFDIKEIKMMRWQ